MFNFIVSQFETMERKEPADLLAAMLAAPSDDGLGRFSAAKHVMSGTRSVQKFERVIDMGTAEPGADDPVKSAELLTMFRHEIEPSIPEGKTVVWLDGPLFVRRRDGIRACRAVVTFV